MAYRIGNLHCHSTRSDGNSPAPEVAAMYRDAGFDFLAITDHNTMTGAADCLPTKGITILNGSEYTARVGQAQTHVNGIGVDRALMPVPGDQGFRDPVEALQQAVDQVRAAGGFSILNHPNWHWSYGAAEICRVVGADAFELGNNATTCNNDGDSVHPSTERMWDEVLSAGQRLWGVCTDDCHQPVKLKFWNDPPFSGWVGIDDGGAEELDRGVILKALHSGSFYSSGLGLRLSRVEMDPEYVVIYLPEWDRTTYRTTFVGHGGTTLAVVDGMEAVYRIRGGERYVRARVDMPGRVSAYTQPLFLDGR